jgi:hypothetical protein
VAIALIANTTVSAAAGATATTGAIDTTGANFLCIAASNYGFNSATATITDSKGNTWTALTNYSASNANIAIWYSKNPTVGTGHTFSGTGSYISLFVSAWSGVDTTAPFDVENGAGNASCNSLQPGSITPAANGSLLITALSDNDVQTLSINSSFTILNQQRNNSYATGGHAYLIQTTAAAINPLWTAASGLNYRSVTIAAFKAAGGGGGSQAIAAVLSGAGTLSAVQTGTLKLASAMSGAGTLSVIQKANLKLVAAMEGLGDASMVQASSSQALSAVLSGLSDLAAILKRSAPISSVISGTGTLTTLLKSTLKLSSTFSGVGSLSARLAPIGTIQRILNRMSLRIGIGL